MADTAAALPTVAPAVVVRLRGVRKSFHLGSPIETEVLHGIDLSLNAGEFCAVMGPSGSGKSTLLNIVGLLDRPSSGTLEVCGQETTTLDDRELTRMRGHSIGFVFQYHHLITAFTALENVMIPMLGAAEFPNDAMRERAKELIDSVGLTAWSGARRCFLSPTISLWRGAATRRFRSSTAWSRSRARLILSDSSRSRRP